MNIKTFLLLATIGSASFAGAADTTVVRGPNFDPDRHAKVTAALAAGDTATVNAIRAEHRAQMQAKHQGKGMGQGGMNGQAKGGHGGHGGKGGKGGKGGHGGQCQGGAKTGSN
ncbi:MAG: hypothetical protein IPK50_18910 [Fibrobacterota bacterium]|nr:MAG: hypothetical protein IPK50_18910 [Fibrobacterota bacterium]